ncbi:hypothetical protein CAEBREN_17050 [Caenorhabditis brenneri]|uniref:Uncharacterized protein n=1 Tax=Caenorhabditis brenneri TaxID=135651 RepID=G0MMT1_CAEBE|nr:hypothetical protein CAEBREN_17050 [Caenorhabditis brenneri]
MFLVTTVPSNQTDANAPQEALDTDGFIRKLQRFGTSGSTDELHEPPVTLEKLYYSNSRRHTTFGIINNGQNGFAADSSQPNSSAYFDKLCFYPIPTFSPNSSGVVPKMTARNPFELFSDWGLTKAIGDYRKMANASPPPILVSDIEILYQEAVKNYARCRLSHDPRIVNSIEQLYLFNPKIRTKFPQETPFHHPMGSTLFKNCWKLRNRTFNNGEAISIPTLTTLEALRQAASPEALQTSLILSSYWDWVLQNYGNDALQKILQFQYIILQAWIKEHIRRSEKIEKVIVPQNSTVHPLVPNQRPSYSEAVDHYKSSPLTWNPRFVNINGKKQRNKLLFELNSKRTVPQKVHCYTPPAHALYKRFLKHEGKEARKFSSLPYSEQVKWEKLQWKIEEERNLQRQKGYITWCGK